MWTSRKRWDINGGRCKFESLHHEKEKQHYRLHGDCDYRRNFESNSHINDNLKSISLWKNKSVIVDIFEFSVFIWRFNQAIQINRVIEYIIEYESNLLVCLNIQALIFNNLRGKISTNVPYENIPNKTQLACLSKIDCIRLLVFYDGAHSGGISSQVKIGTKSPRRRLYPYMSWSWNIHI